MIKKLFSVLISVVALGVPLVAGVSPASAATYSVVLTSRSQSSANIQGSQFRVKQRDIYDELRMRYQVMLGRDASYSEVGGWVSGGWTAPNLTVWMQSSSEFTTGDGLLSNSAFVTAKYQDAYGVNPDSGGHAYWLSALNTGTTRASFVESLLDDAGGAGDAAWARYGNQLEMHSTLGTYTTASNGQVTVSLNNSSTSHYSVRLLSVPAPYYYSGDTILPLVNSRTFISNTYAQVTVYTRNPYNTGSVGSVPIVVNGVNQVTSSVVAGGSYTFQATAASGTVTVQKLTKTTGTPTIFYAPTTVTQTYSSNNNYVMILPYYDVVGASSVVADASIRMVGASTDVSVATTVSNFTANGPTVDVEWKLYGPYATSALGSKSGNQYGSTVSVTGQTNPGGSAEVFNTGAVAVSDGGWYGWEVVTTAHDGAAGSQPAVTEALGSAGLVFEIRENVSVDGSVDVNVGEFESGVDTADFVLSGVVDDLAVAEVATVRFDIYGPFDEVGQIADGGAVWATVSVNVTGTSSATETVTSSTVSFSEDGWYGVKTSVILDSGTSTVVESSWNAAVSDSVFRVHELVDLKGYAFSRAEDSESFQPVEDLGVLWTRVEDSGELTGIGYSGSDGFLGRKVWAGYAYCAAQVSVPNSKLSDILALNPSLYWGFDEVVASQIEDSSVGGLYDGTISGNAGVSAGRMLFDGVDDTVTSPVLPVGGSTEFSVAVTFTPNETFAGGTETVFSLIGSSLSAGEVLSVNLEENGSGNLDVVLDMLGTPMTIGSVVLGQRTTLVLIHNPVTGVTRTVLEAPLGGVPTYSTSSVGSLTGSPRLYAGSFYGFARRFEGTMGDVSVYAHGLSDSDVVDLYAAADKLTYVVSDTDHCTNGTVDQDMVDGEAVQIFVMHEGELTPSGFAFSANGLLGLLLVAGFGLVSLGILADKPRYCSSVA